MDSDLLVMRVLRMIFLKPFFYLLANDESICGDNNFCGSASFLRLTTKCQR